MERSCINVLSIEYSVPHLKIRNILLQTLQVNKFTPGRPGQYLVSTLSRPPSPKHHVCNHASLPLRIGILPVLAMLPGDLAQGWSRITAAVCRHSILTQQPSHVTSVVVERRSSVSRKTAFNLLQQVSATSQSGGLCGTAHLSSSRFPNALQEKSALPVPPRASPRIPVPAPSIFGLTVCSRCAESRGTTRG